MSDSWPRPLYHFTPQKNHMNDPNGLVFHDGTWHLYFQYNPYGLEFTNQSWGHATSTDLLHWDEQPVAIWVEPEQRYIYSGSAIVDTENTAGFGAGAYLAYYTVHKNMDDGGARETIEMAISTDGGLHYQPYADNPLIDVRSKKFGDPKVCWHEEAQCWLMLCILGWPSGSIAMYRSTNLRDWEFASIITHPDVPDCIWECPDLFQLSTDDGEQKWVVKVSLPLRGWQCIGTAYLIGNCDGTVFQTESMHMASVGDDYYAEICWEGNNDGRTVQIGWLRQNVRDGRAWKSMQSIPRTLSLQKYNDDWRILARPAQELLDVCQEYSGPQTIGNGASIDLPSAACRLRVNEITGSLTLILHGRNESMTLTLSAQAAIVIVPGRSLQQEDCKDGEVIALNATPFEIYLDHEAIELFSSDGSIAAGFTEAVPADMRQISVSANDAGAALQIDGIDIIVI